MSSHAAIAGGSMVNPKFQIGDKVWTIEDNRFEEKKISGISIFMRDNSSHVFYELEGLHTSGLKMRYPSQENLHPEREVFATLDKLIEYHKEYAISSVRNNLIRKKQ